MLTQEEAPQARHVVVSADNQPSTVLEAIDAVACGYLPKAAVFSTMTAVLQVKVASGRRLCTGT
jgi:DNA-binding NarL/FixJ family response regulator